MRNKTHYALNWESTYKVVCKVKFDQSLSHSVTKTDLEPLQLLRSSSSHKEIDLRNCSGPRSVSELIFKLYWIAQQIV